jgi:HipA-like protein
MSNYKKPNVVAVDVFAESRKSRRYVGRLSKELTEKVPRFVFRYDPKYLRARFSLAVGPELPLTRREYFSPQLFPSFTDRLPSPENPAYQEYLDKFNLLPSEKDPLLLLTTIGRAGPSSFIFEPVLEETFENNLKFFRNELGLTVRDFSVAFDVAGTSVQRIEKGIAGKEIMKRIELYYRFPETAIFEVKRNGSKLHESVRTKLLQKLIARKEKEDKSDM